MEVRIDKVTKEFGRFAAVKEASLTIGDGELIALLGPSGSGKTTLLRLIAGLEQPTSGAVYFGDEDASQKRVQDRNVGFVFQHYALFKHMTVLDNVGFGLKVRPSRTRPAREEIRARARELLRLVQLEGLERRYPQQISGGQRQRVALARAMAIEPRVLLLDEPFGALDAQVRKDLRRWLRDLHDRTRHTTVFVTHDQEEALELADRVVVLNQGRIEQVGSADEIFDRPGSPFVFGFIGDSAALPVKVDRQTIGFDGSALRLHSASAPNGSARLFFRPQDALIVDHGGIEGVVTGVRRRANLYRLDLAVNGAGKSVEIDAPHPPEIGARLSFIPRRWALYPEATPHAVYGASPEFTVPRTRAFRAYTGGADQ